MNLACVSSKLYRHSGTGYGSFAEFANKEISCTLAWSFAAYLLEDGDVCNRASKGNPPAKQGRPLKPRQCPAL